MRCDAFLYMGVCVRTCPMVEQGKVMPYVKKSALRVCDNNCEVECKCHANLALSNGVCVCREGAVYNENSGVCACKSGYYSADDGCVDSGTCKGSGKVIFGQQCIAQSACPEGYGVDFKNESCVPVSVSGRCPYVSTTDGVRRCACGSEWFLSSARDECVSKCDV